MYRHKLRSSISALIGNTPLIELHYGIPNARIFVKLETHNLTGSIKDRMALYMIKKAQERKRLNDNSTIIEATTGNTGIAFAALAKLFGYKMIAIIPSGQSLERINMMKAYGAEVITTKHADGPAGSVKLRDKLAKEIKNSWVPDQFGNPDNVEEHKNGTAKEILKQLDGEKIDYFVHGVGTGGTLMGIGPVLKNEYSKMKTIALEPAESAVLLGKNPGIHNIQGIGEGFVPSIVDNKHIDDIVTVSTKDAIKETKRIAHDTGLYVGFSSGANISAIKNMAKEHDTPRTYLTVFADRGERYMSVQ